MRLALIRQRYTPFGGAERFIESALAALLERDVAVTLYTREWPETDLQLMEPIVVDPFFVGRLWRDWGFARAACRAVARGNADLVQSHERLLCCDIFRAGDGVHAVWLEEKDRGASALARFLTAMSPYHHYVKWVERRMFAQPSLAAVICNSQMVKDEIAARFGVPAEKLHVIYNAVDGTIYSPALRAHREAVREALGIPEQAIVFLLVGSGYERKGVATAIAALANAPDAQLVVVGREKDVSAYQRAAHEAGVARRVTLAGPQADAKPFFGAADAFVLPTRYDPLPNATLEAMSCGLPVVTSTKSGAAELVAQHDAGFVCDSRDAASLALHMRALMDAATRERLGVNARRAVEGLTPEAMTLSLVLLYKALLEASVTRRKASKAKTPPPADPVSEPAPTAGVDADPVAQIVDTSKLGNGRGGAAPPLRDDAGAQDPK
ncbi:MAG TPA: glycosyltransferase family 4 protein [Casimicrobiaceae bacterium]|nr:glycosyltransferase family 4 protein [Casimicrobiaceae bacterium]